MATHPVVTHDERIEARIVRRHDEYGTERRGQPRLDFLSCSRLRDSHERRDDCEDRTSERLDAILSGEDLRLYLRPRPRRCVDRVGRLCGRGHAPGKGVVVLTTFTATGGLARREGRHNLIRHFVEMVLAMIVGMAVLGVVVQMICAALGHSGFFLDHAGLRAPLMAMNMTIGMAVWMRHRRHGWAPIGEMGAAMFLPLAVLIGPFWAGVLSGDALLTVMHVLMFPAMVVALLHRRDEYAQDHHRHHAAVPSQPAA